jgi:hypothetical protein
MLGLPPDVIIVLPSEMATSFVAAGRRRRLLVKADYFLDRDLHLLPSKRSALIEFRRSALPRSKS